MNRSRQLLCLVLAFFMMSATLLTGCGASPAAPASATPAPASVSAEATPAPSASEVAAATPEAKESVELEFWAHWGSPTRRPIIEKIVSDFNAASDYITVKYVYLPWGDVWTKNAASIAAGNPCDAIINDVNSVPKRASDGQMESLKPFLEKEPEIAERFYPHLWDVMKYDGEVYALPFNTDTRVVLYNKLHFAEAGLNPDEYPKTWEDLWDYADKLDKKTADGKYERIGFYPGYGDLGWEIWLLNADKGLSWFDYANGNAVSINTPAKVEALNWLKKWSDRYGTDNINAFKAEFGARERNAFINGKVSIYPANINFMTQIRDYASKDTTKFDYGIIPVPEFTPGNGNWTWGGGFDIEIPRGAKDPAASWEFIKFMTDAPAQTYWATWGYDIMGNTAANMDEGLQSVPFFKFATENMASTVFTPAPIEAPDFGNLINPEYDAFMLGKQDAATALKNAQEAIEELVDENR